MEVLTPYLLQLATGVFTSLTVCWICRQVSIGIAGNILTGLAGGFIAAMMMQWIWVYLPAHILSSIGTAVIVTLPLTLLIGTVRRKIPQPD